MLINQAQCNTENLEESQIMSIETQYWVEQKEALERLEKNEDFKTVILNGYFKDKAINGVSLLSTDYVRSRGIRGELMETLVAISALEDHFATIKNLGTVPVDSEE